MSEFIEIVWLWGVCVLLMLTLPIWFIPYTTYKVWTYFQGGEA